MQSPPLQFSLCRLRNHQWCFLLFNVLLFHALLFGADFVEEYLLQPTPGIYTDSMVLDIREKARKLDLSGSQDNVSQSYPISNPNACLNSDLFLLTFVFSHPSNVSQRDAVRAAWANVSYVQGFPVRTLFFLGSAPSSANQKAVLRESGLHGDLVQGHVTMTDSLRSQTERTVLVLRWVVTFCPTARFLLLAEEAVFVNLPAVAGYLLGLHRHPEDFYLGRVIHKDPPDRDPSSPGYLPPALYPRRYLPDYCSGSAFVLSQDVVRKVFVASSIVHSPVPSDVFVGLCAEKAGVVPVHSARFSGDKHVRYNACCYRWLFSSAGVGAEELGQVWGDVGQEDDGCSVLETYYGLVACKALTYLDKLSSSSQQQMGNNSDG